MTQYYTIMIQWKNINGIWVCLLSLT